VSGTLTQASLNCERDAHASPPTFVLTTQRLEYLAKLQRNQDSVSRWKAKVGGQAALKINYTIILLERQRARIYIIYEKSSLGWIFEFIFSAK
jgi:hypothetical protein